MFVFTKPTSRSQQSGTASPLRSHWRIPWPTSWGLSKEKPIGLRQTLDGSLVGIAHGCRWPWLGPEYQVVGHSYIVYGPLLQGCATVLPWDWHDGYDSVWRLIIIFMDDMIGLLIRGLVGTLWRKARWSEARAMSKPNALLSYSNIPKEHLMLAHFGAWFRQESTRQQWIMNVFVDWIAYI